MLWYRLSFLSHWILLYATLCFILEFDDGHDGIIRHIHHRIPPEFHCSVG